ncbi:MAG: sterol desaturase family protein [Devosiaceae bacterium]|nr:sterol desaturase family protein [Devosiaceae bacterium MH13]
MPEFSEATVRLMAFVGIFASMALFEQLLPRRERYPARGRRWLTNWGMLIVDSIVLRVIFPAAAVGVALWAEAAGFGLFNVISVPPILAALVVIVVLDFAVWLEHVVSHHWPWLWRIHKVHHADVDLDVTSALRFHPIEILVSMVWKGAVVALLGAPAVAVLIFEIILNGMAMFNHSNVKLPLWLDRLLRPFVVTPDMHRIHHSIIERETNTNYGFNLSVWDRLFGVYTADPQAGQAGMIIGLAEHQNPQPTGLVWSLLLPFRNVVKLPDAEIGQITQQTAREGLAKGPVTGPEGRAGTPSA